MTEFIEVTIIRCKNPSKLEHLKPNDLEANDLIESRLIINLRAVLTVLPTEPGTGFRKECCKISLPIGEFPVAESYRYMRDKLVGVQ